MCECLVFYVLSAVRLSLIQRRANQKQDNSAIECSSNYKFKMEVTSFVFSCDRVCVTNASNSIKQYSNQPLICERENLSRGAMTSSNQIIANEVSLRSPYKCTYTVWRSPFTKVYKHSRHLGYIFCKNVAINVWGFSSHFVQCHKEM